MARARAHERCVHGGSGGGRGQLPRPAALASGRRAGGSSSEASPGHTGAVVHAGRGDHALPAGLDRAHNDRLAHRSGHHPRDARGDRDTVSSGTHSRPRGEGGPAGRDRAQLERLQPGQDRGAQPGCTGNRAVRTRSMLRIERTELPGRTRRAASNQPPCARGGEGCHASDRRKV